MSTVKQTVSLIAALAHNRAIGKDNALLWHLPEDLKYFRTVTAGRPVIMGRKTWESLPEKFRPLPNRLNIVVTHQKTYQVEGARRVNSLEDALIEAGEGEVFVIGGASLYAEALPFAHRMYLTEIEETYEADAFFPMFSLEDWEETHRQQGGDGFYFVRYERRVKL